MQEKNSFQKTICFRCNNKTISARKGRAWWICVECGNDKTLSDIMLPAIEKENRGKDTVSKMRAGKN